jgi:branched-chain amino acid transport system ATP-binding protein
LPPHRIINAGIGRTFQIPRPFHRLSIFENVALAGFYGQGRHSRAGAFDAAEHALRLVGLPVDRGASVDGLGAAGLKKLELAKALATGPKLLLADESLGGLDESEMEQAAEMLRRIRGELGITIIWVEHIMGALMRVISGLIRPRNGAISMEGTDLRATPAHRILALGIAHVPENRRLFPRMTVEENLRMGAFIPAARANFSTCLAFVYDLFPRLSERRRQLAGTMSGGKQQMCAIGRALMSEPRLLLLDEPSAGLAPVIVQQVFALVERIRASGLTVLIVEQNVHQVLRVVDRAYLLEAGSIRASGTAAELLQSATIRASYLGV